MHPCEHRGARCSRIRAYACTHARTRVAVSSPCGKAETHAAAEKGGHMSGNGGHPLRVGVPVGIRIYHATLPFRYIFCLPPDFFLARRLPAYARMTRRPLSRPANLPREPPSPFSPPLVRLVRPSAFVTQRHVEHGGFYFKYFRFR